MSGPPALTAAGCRARRDRLWAALPRGCNALVVTQPEHVNYLSGCAPSSFEFRANEAAVALVLLPDRAILVGDNLLAADLDAAHVDERAVAHWYRGEVAAANRRDVLAGQVRAVLDVVRPRVIGIEAATCPRAYLAGLEASGPLDVVEVGSTIRSLRRRKDPDELAILRASLRASDAAMAATLDQVEPGMTEHAIYRLVAQAAQQALGEAAVVYGDFVSGPRCERVGGPPSDRVVGDGELVLLDYSVVARGYRGDVANTFVAGTRPPDGRVRRWFDACAEALGVGESLLRPGVPTREIDAAVRGVLSAADTQAASRSHVGHGLGLGHPEPPYIVPGSDEVLAEGDVVTLEPGMYQVGVAGMRYERNYVITSEGFETLSGHPIVLERG